MRLVGPVAAAALAALAACGGGTGDRSTLPPLACAGRAAPGIAPSHLLVGLAGDDASAARPGFDLRYQYLAGPVAPDASCYDPARTNAVGCGTTWWGTWQWDQLPPGQFVRDFVKKAEDVGLLPMFTWYVILPASGVPEGMPEATQAATDAVFMARYLADFRFFLRQLGAHAALVHVEPDFWGYAEQAAHAAGVSPQALPAAVASAEPACAAYPNTMAGLGQCLVHLVRALAPNAKVGLHASPWGSGVDMASNADPSVSAAAQGAAVGAFLLACGAGDADVVVADLADRDAAFYQLVLGQNRWLDATDATLPSFAQLFAWSKAVADRVGRPILWWQIPVGNMSLSNTTNQYQDNRLDYFFQHTDRVAAGGAIGMAFGAGGAQQTSPETDGGHLFAAAAALRDRGGQPLCP